VCPIRRRGRPRAHDIMAARAIIGAFGRESADPLSLIRTVCGGRWPGSGSENGSYVACRTSLMLLIVS
jgi:hypothetical protein